MIERRKREKGTGKSEKQRARIGSRTRAESGSRQTLEGHEASRLALHRSADAVAVQQHLLRLLARPDLSCSPSHLYVRHLRRDRIHGRRRSPLSQRRRRREVHPSRSFGERCSGSCLTVCGRGVGRQAGKVSFAGPDGRDGRVARGRAGRCCRRRGMRNRRGASGRRSARVAGRCRRPRRPRNAFRSRGTGHQTRDLMPVRRLRESRERLASGSR